MCADGHYMSGAGVQVHGLRLAISQQGFTQSPGAKKENF